jgi:hypothetical protein
MTRHDIVAAIEKCPGLNAFGVGVYCGVKLADREQWIEANRQELLDDVDGCTRAESWLRGHAKRKTVNRSRSSYGLKHVAAHKVGYLTNGAFIAAAIHLGFPFDVPMFSPNPLIGISERSLRNEYKQRREQERQGQ